MDRSVFSYVHEFKGFGNCDCKCRVHIKEVPNPRYDTTYFVCFEDIGIGTSVTNISEQLATEIVDKHNLDPQNCRFFESYVYNNEPRSLDEIKYTWDGKKASKPDWSPLDLDLKHVFNFD